jgi:ribose transport system substrate-binding protein
MRKKWILQLVLPLLGLSAIFFLLAFAPGQSRNQPPLLEMSVILRKADSASFALRQGMEQAAADLNVELRFLMPSADNCAQEQAQLLQREAESGAAAILLIPADRTALEETVAAAAEKTALVTLESDMTEQGAIASVSVDHAAIGRALGQAALRGVPDGGTVLLLDSVPGDNGIRERMEAAAALLKEKGRTVRTCQWTEAGWDDRNLPPAEQADAVLAFEEAALEQAAEIERNSQGFPLVYGAGSTSAIAAGLERGRITAIAAENVFSAGYLAVEAAAAAARHEAVGKIPAISFSMIRKESMYEEENQKLLFPVL